MNMLNTIKTYWE